MRIKLGIAISSAEIASLYEHTKLPDIEFSHIVTDSREAMEKDLFFSLCSSTDESQRHIAEARSKGAVTLGFTGEIMTDDPRGALLSIAALYKSKLPRLRCTVMITGSVGKTTTKEILYHIVCTKFRAHKNEGNYNNAIGLPLTVLSAPEECEVLILEAGMNHPGEISTLSYCAKPDIAIITAIGTSHIGNLGSREAIADAKLEILDGMSNGALLCDADEPLLRGAKMRKTFSTRDKNADYALLPCGCINQNKFVFYAPNSNGMDIEIPRAARHIATDIVAAAGAAHLLGVSSEDIKKRLSSIKDTMMRHRVIKTDKILLLDDSYNSSLESLKASIDLLMSYECQKSSALIADILELGDHAEGIHEKVGEYASRSGISCLYLCGENAEAIKKGALRTGMQEHLIHIFKNTDNLSDIAKFIIKNSCSEEMLLVKGSHATGIYKIIDYFKRGEDG